MKTLLITIFFALTLSISANANYWVEPVLGYTNGKLEFGSNSFDTDGIYYGIRAGRRFKNIFKLGGTITTGATTIKANSNSDTKTSQLGLYAGAEVTPSFNVFAEYFLASSILFDNSNAKWKSNIGYKAGFLYTGLPLFSLGLNYKMVTYNTVESTTFNGAPLKEDPKINAFEVVVGLRF